MIFKKKVRIVVSLTTIPTRINKIKPVLESILMQSIKPDRIYLNVPDLCTRLNATYILPNWLKEMTEITINRCSDYGPATKLLPTLKIEKEPDTLILFLDDDVAIRKDLLKKYLQIKNKFRGSILALATVNIEPNSGNLFSEKRHGKAEHIFEAYGTVLIERRMVKDDIWNDFFVLQSPFHLADDLFFSNYFAKNKVKIIQVNKKKFNINNFSLVNGNAHSTTTYYNDTYALHNQNSDSGGNARIYADAMKHKIFPYLVET